MWRTEFRAKGQVTHDRHAGLLVARNDSVIDYRLADPVDDAKFLNVGPDVHGDFPWTDSSCAVDVLSQPEIRLEPLAFFFR